MPLYTLSFVKFLQVIELDLNQLPDGDEVLTILRQEQAPLHNWVMLAVCNVTEFILSISHFRGVTEFPTQLWFIFTE